MKNIKLKKKITSNKEAKNILLIGVFNGDEPQGEYIINSFLDDIKNLNLKNNLIYINNLNEAGKISNTRQNINGVDLNRNFPTKNWSKSEKNDFYGGDFAGSENETSFLVELINSTVFDAILTIHAPYKIVNYDGDAFNLAKIISKLVSYPVQKNIGYPTCGSFGTYCGIERKIP